MSPIVSLYFPFLLLLSTHLCDCVDFSDSHDYVQFSTEKYGFNYKSLRIREKSFCEEEKMVLKCPPHTQISLDKVFFGHSSETFQICRHLLNKTPKQEDTFSQLQQQSRRSKRKFENKLNPAVISKYCLAVDAYSQLVEICQNKRRCLIKQSSYFHNLSNCTRDVTKHLHVAYRCRPSQFNGEFYCENEEMKITCQQKHRIAVYAAVYGSVPPHGSGNCQKTARDIYFDCSTDVLPIVAEQCHAKKECQLTVKRSLFLSRLHIPVCPETLNRQLVVTFICVDEIVFTDATLEAANGIAVGMNEYVKDDDHQLSVVKGLSPMNDEQQEISQPSTENGSLLSNSLVKLDQNWYSKTFTPTVFSSLTESSSAVITDNNNFTATTISTLSPSTPNLLGLWKCFQMIWIYCLFLTDRKKQTATLLLAACGFGILVVVVVTVCSYLCDRRKNAKKSASAIQAPPLNGPGTSHFHRSVGDDDEDDHHPADLLFQHYISSGRSSAVPFVHFADDDNKSMPAVMKSLY
ncbi:Protein eva-1 [Trichinella pseudospiralis]|uniref:Protein eva-1 n=1 Tax=Trichinella pseudospiralis TaxID=6337 RepID=A0A0V1E8Z5_TRIPS|nr:Protein eva-1 [Trichinella pseudospiralis]KRZ38580.1 Protein eva-1 [Trichinella pseudospiralis]